MCTVTKDERRGWTPYENMDPTEHKAISTSGTKVKHKPRSYVCLMDVFNMAQMLLKS